MGNIKRHPLYLKADALKRAFLLHGFTLSDNGEKPELEPASADITLFHRPSDIAYETISLEDGSWALRTSLLPSQLNSMKDSLPVKAISCGRVYDGRDQVNPQRLVIEGVIAVPELTMIDLTEIWNQIAADVYGIGACATLSAAEKDTLKITVKTACGKEKSLGFIGPANWLARAILGLTDETLPIWLFTIDIDEVVVADLEPENRAALYDSTAPFLSQTDCAAPCAGFDFSSKAANILRGMGYLEFVGDKFYTADAYVRMNMIQEAWDTNNKGIVLRKPLEYESELTELTTREGLPTVLTPALEQAMYENFKAGVPEVKLFELAHIFKPGQNGGKPWEKVSLSFGAYRKDLTFREFLADVDAFLTKLGIRNHFFIPTTMAIAYRQDQCMVILDEKMRYLDGNFGHISPKALANFKIGSEGFMAQFELDTLENKAKEEYGFIPYENR